MLTSADGEIRWSDPAPAIDCRVRGVTPAPGAHTFYDGARLRLGPVAVVPEVADLLPGQLRVTKHDVLVGTGACAVRLGQVAPAGKKWMAAEAWARGARPPVGAVLGVQGREPGRGMRSAAGARATEAMGAPTDRVTVPGVIADDEAMPTVGIGGAMTAVVSESPRSMMLGSSAFRSSQRCARTTPMPTSCCPAFWTGPVWVGAMPASPRL